MIGDRRSARVAGSAKEVTATVHAYSHGDADAEARLLPLVYDELRRIAARYLQRERRGHSLQPTELVHEAYIRLVDLDRIDWQGKTHFRAMASRQMRRVLVDHARRVRAAKRDHGVAVTFTEEIALVPGASVEVLALEEALGRLAETNPRPCQVAELRFFAGMEVEEVAHILGVHPSTVKNDWRFARAWLSRELAPHRAQNDNHSG